MTDDEPVCGYCAHPTGCHVDGQCFNDVRGVHGWRQCTCTGFIEAGAA